jgi:hypothetical protein
MACMARVAAYLPPLKRPDFSSLNMYNLVHKVNYLEYKSCVTEAVNNKKIRDGISIMF